jgi:hypothetical protein
MILSSSKGLKMLHLTECKREVLAMAIDCEGWIAFACNKKQNYNIVALVGISNTKIKLLRHIQDMTGIGSIGPKPKPKGKRAQGYQWNLRSYEMRAFLEAIQPYLIIKSEQCELALKFLKYGWSRPLNTEDINLREEWAEKMIALNERGA